MIIKITFYKSSSKYYNSACLQCENIGKYNQEKTKNTLVLSMDDLRTKYMAFRNLFEILRHWSKTEYCIDDCDIGLEGMNDLLSTVDCEATYDNSELLGEYCYGECGWGCKHICSISLRRPSYYGYNSSKKWYEFGYFSEGVWNIDKNRILEILQRDIKQHHLMACTHFDMNRITQAMDTLPDVINVEDSKDWEYKYREAPMGIKQTEIIGIEPKEYMTQGFSYSFPISHDDNDEDNKQKTRNVPSTTFKDIGGIDNIVQQVREVIELPLVAPKLFEHYHIKPHKGILLYGPPGCGKTLIAKAVANEIKAHFISVNGPEVLNKFVGQSEANLRSVFKEATEKSPSIIYFDEFDSISSTRDADGNPLMATVVNQLLTLMDGIGEEHQICAIASTNRIDMIDPAIKRPGRFDYVIEIKKPSPDGCKAIFRIHTENMPIVANFDRDAFVEKFLIGCSGAEIAFVASEAAYNSIRRTIDIAALFESGVDAEVSSANIISEQDFVNAAMSLKESQKRADSAKWRYS